MSKWKVLEKECLDYLNEKYSSDRVKFESTGGSDSNSPDIKVYIDGENKFNIEVKSASAQSGQFVVLKEHEKFVFSTKNKSNAEEATPFLVYMNNNYEKFENVGTARIVVDMPIQEFHSWIINHYLSKNEIYVITKEGNDFIVFPTQKYGEYFDITCSYRIKVSGSRNVSKKYFDEVNKFFENNKLEYRGKYLTLITDEVYCKNQIINIGENLFLISNRVEDGYKITMKGKTQNPNIIFSIKLEKSQEPCDLSMFEEELQ